MLSGSTLAVTGTLYKKPPFDATKDFVPVALVVHYPFLLVASKSLPANSVPELIHFAKQHPGKLLYASPGVATSQHLFAELFKVTTGTDLGHIPYNGTSPAVVDIVAGRVSLMFAAAAPSLPLIKDGSLKVLGVSSAERLAEAPDIPPIADAVPGFDVSNWSIILAPAGTPREIVNKLHAELKTVMAIPGRPGSACQDRDDPDRQPHSRGARIVRQFGGDALGPHRAAGRYRRIALTDSVTPEPFKRKRRQIDIGRFAADCARQNIPAGSRQR